MAEDFEIPDDSRADAPEARPVIVVHARGRGLSGALAVPLVILILAAAVLSHRVRTRDWQGPGDLIGRRPTLAPEPAPAPTAEVAPAPARPMVARLVDAVPLAPISQPRPGARPFAALPPLPLAIALPPPIDPSEETALARADILREAAKNRAELARRDQFEDIKDRLFARDQEALLGRRADRMAKESFDADRERAAFRNEIRRILRRDPDGRAGESIAAFCEQKGLRLGIDRRRAQAKSSGYTPAGRRDRVESFRSSGMSEPKILDDLVCLEMRQIVARSGPKDKVEAIERAARQLLQVPLTATPDRTHPRPRPAK